MCGICGFNWEDKELVKSMSDVLEHRGPDESDHYIDENVSLGHRRLKIIDLSARGRQPMSNEDDSIWLIFNGEIYNFKELREDLEKKGHKFRSDTDSEVIIHSYEEYGVDCFKSFNGMFALCIYDSQKKTLLLARDRVGIKPLYFYHNENKFIFSSEIKAILKHDIPRIVCNSALNKYMAFRYNPSHLSLIKDVMKLEPGAYITYNLKDNSLKASKFWTMEDFAFSKTKLTIDQASNRLLALLRDSVKKRMVADVPVGVYLSGGLDSTCIVGLMKELTNDVKTYTVDIGTDQRAHDVSFAKIAAEHYNTEHKEISVGSEMTKVLPQINWYSDEPLADPAMIPTYLLSKKIKREVTVVENGAGGDEIFGGYTHHHFMKLRKPAASTPKFIHKAGMGIVRSILGSNSAITKKSYIASYGKSGTKRFTTALTNADSRSNFYLKIVEILDAQERQELLSQKVTSDISVDLKKEYHKKYFNLKHDFLREVYNLEAQHFLVENVLMHTDKMTMAASLEARVPLLDHRIVELCMSLPTSYKSPRLQSKFVFKKAIKTLLPDSILKRKKQGFFVPIDQWIRHDLKDPVTNILTSKDIAAKDYFKPQILDKYAEKIRHLDLYTARQIWSILNFDIWHRIHIDGENPKNVSI